MAQASPLTAPRPATCTQRTTTARCALSVVSAKTIHATAGNRASAENHPRHRWKPSQRTLWLADIQVMVLVDSGYEFWLMKEAKKRNPSMVFYGLPWAWPSWVGGSGSSPWTNLSLPVRYIVDWVRGAKEEHGIDVGRSLSKQLLLHNCLGRTKPPSCPTWPFKT